MSAYICRCVQGTTEQWYIFINLKNTKDIKTSTPPVAALVKRQRISWTLTQRHRLMPWSEYLCPTQNWYVENLMFGVMLLVGITLMNGISAWQRGSRGISSTWQSSSRKISSPSCHEDTVRRYRLRTTKRTLTRSFHWTPWSWTSQHSELWPITMCCL